MNSLAAAGWKKLSEGPWSKRRKHQAVKWNDSLLLLGGFDGESALDLNDVWSWDGKNWSMITGHSSWSGRDGHCVVILNDIIYLVGGTDDPYMCKNDVWRSDDGGKFWTQINSSASWPERWQHAACSHNGYIYISGGWGNQYFNDVWRSDDGITWSKVCLHCPWKPRMFHSFISYNNTLYILGGHDGKEQLNDVWASSDGGFTWVEVCNIAPWERRQGHVTVVTVDCVYLMGGFGGSIRYNDLWKSTDCAHWILVSRRCDWSPRQGHACVEFRGSLCLLGGFDESGYCNNMYSYDIPSLNAKHHTSNMISHEADGANSKRIVTVSLECVLESISKLHEARCHRESAVLKMGKVIDLVMSAVNYRHRSSNTNSIVKESIEVSGIDILTSTTPVAHELSLPDEKPSSPSAQSTPRMSKKSPIEQLIKGIRPNVVDGHHQENDYSMHASIADLPNLSQPLMSVSDAWEIDETLNKSLDTHDYGDLGLDTPAKSYDIEDDNSDHNNEFHNISSAHLRESMESQRKGLVQLQRNIRLAAEGGENEKVTRLQEERTSLALSSMLQAKKLHQHTKILTRLQKLRQNYLYKVSHRLEHLDKPSSADIITDEATINPDANMTQCSWIEWNAILDQFTNQLSKFREASMASDAAIYNFRSTLEELADLNMKISQWAKMNLMSILSDSDLIPSSSVSASSNISDIEGTLQSNLTVDHNELTSKYELLTAHVDKYKMNIKISIDKEIKGISDSSEMLISFLKTVVEKGKAFINGLISQNRIDVMEITSMGQEVEDWCNRLLKLSKADELLQTCQSLIRENTGHEENLIKLEDDRIDIKSALEKASFRRPVQKISSTSPIKLPKSDSDNQLNKYDQLKDAVATAEQRVRDARRDMRKWYRETRKFAIEYAPELFLYIPDLRSPGSILGDGGFAEKTKLPRRRLEDYENLHPLLSQDEDNEGEGKGNAFGRHLLLKATYDNEDVVMKGFVVHDVQQRQGLERELSILGRLRNDSIICPLAIVEDSSALFEASVQVTVFIVYPYYKGGNLSNWLKAMPRKPWDLQSIARQLLYGLSYLHDHSVIHKDIKPSNVLLHDDGRVVLTDFELSKDISNHDGEEASISKVGTRGFMAPEIESGQPAVFASDMYSFGVLLFYMHFPNNFTSNIIAGNIRIPNSTEPELVDLLKKLVSVNPSQRPTANTALMHPYFRTTFAEKLLRDGEVVEQDRKLEAVRSMLHQCRTEYRNHIENITIHRDNLVHEVLSYFREASLDKIRSNLRITFVGEPGVDEGGLLTELFSFFYESIFQGEGKLFEGSASLENKKSTSSANSTADDYDILDDQSNKVLYTSVVLPTTNGLDDPNTLRNFRAFGRAMVKTLYEGRRIGSKLCPSVFKYITLTNPNMRDLQTFDPETARSLQWTLATMGVEEYGLHFESVNSPELGPVNDANKSKFVLMKIHQILVESRKNQLAAIKAGFIEAMNALSEEAAPFLSLLSHADWRVLLCGESAVNGAQIISCFKFHGFPSKSNIPQWLKEIIMSSSDDHLRQLLVFMTGSPSLPTTFSSTTLSSSNIEITVRCQSRSNALPIAHTCFFQLDIPDYRSKEILQSKLIYAIQNTNTFEIV